LVDPAKHQMEEAWDDAEDYDGRPRTWIRLAAVAGIVALAGVGLGLWLSLGGSSSSAHTGPEGVSIQKVPDLASPDTTVAGAPVDGIECGSGSDEYHIHAHLAIFVNGRQERIPAGAGIVSPRSSEQTPKGLFVDNSGNSCLYWLHAHADDGIIHVESPSKEDFSLGQFFDIWGQPLGNDQVGPARGTVVAFVNGKRFVGNPRDIPLLNQADIQLDVGNPAVPFKPFKFNVTGQCSQTQNCQVPQRS
jgi:hypothetical protein